MAEAQIKRRLAAVFAADVVSYSRMIEADEAGTRARLVALQNEQIGPRIASAGGRVVKTTGDGLLGEFPSAVDAVSTALQIQAAVKRYNVDLPEACRIVLRIGINVGDVIIENDDIHGDGVNVAARLEGICGPGEVFVSGTVYDQAAGKLAAAFENLGEQRLKNLARPIRVYRASIEANAEAKPTAHKAGAALPPPLPEKPSIAVLPFANLSRDPDQDYFADGVTEDIITALSRIRWLFVIARNTTFTYKGQAVDIKRIAQDLGVRYVLEGSIQKARDRVRVTGQLIDGATGNHIWAERYDRNIEDVFALQDEITDNIAGALEPQIVYAEHQRAQRKSEQNVDAWDLVIRAMARIGEFSKSGSADALALLDRAIAIDPGYARAHSHKAWTLIWRAFQGWEDMATALPMAVDAADRAIRHDAEEPWAYIAATLIAVVLGDEQRLLSSARKAIELNPNFAYAHSLFGAALALSGRGAEGVEWTEKARRLSPRDIFREEFDLHAGFACFQAGDYARAAAFAAEASMPRPEHLYPHLMLAASYGHLGDFGRANREIQTIQSIAPGCSLGAFEQNCVYLRPDDKARFIEGLILAGLPAEADSP